MRFVLVVVTMALVFPVAQAGPIRIPFDLSDAPCIENGEPSPECGPRVVIACVERLDACVHDVLPCLEAEMDCWHDSLPKPCPVDRLLSGGFVGDCLPPCAGDAVTCAIGERDLPCLERRGDVLRVHSGCLGETTYPS